MKIEQRIQAFSNLGKLLDHLSVDEFQSLTAQTRNENPWFTEQNVRMALDGIKKFLTEKSLKQWVSNYNFSDRTLKVGLIMAGNIPLVGFHDMLTILICGHTALLKLSSKDSSLTRFIVEKLIEIEPGFREKIVYVEQLKAFDAVIATGSDNSSRYFEYYFGKYPHIIRKNRTSVAILEGNESHEELKTLGIDIFSYFGLGCRNVSKLFVPEGYTFDTFFNNLNSYSEIIHHHKYCNNYDYQKSILLINRVPFLDNGFLLLQENQKMVSPISVLYYEHYQNTKELKEKVHAVEDKIQCIVGKHNPATIPFGKAQYPSLSDYADNVDTLKFLSTLN